MGNIFAALRHSTASQNRFNHSNTNSQETTAERLLSNPTVLDALMSDKNDSATDQGSDSDTQHASEAHGEPESTNQGSLSSNQRLDRPANTNRLFQELDTDGNAKVTAQELLTGQAQGLTGYSGTTGTHEQFAELLGEHAETGIDVSEFTENAELFAPATQERKDFEYKYRWLQENRLDMASIPDETLRALAWHGEINDEGRVVFTDNGFYGEVGNLNSQVRRGRFGANSIESGDEKKYADRLTTAADYAESKLPSLLANGKSIKVTDLMHDWFAGPVSQRIPSHGHVPAGFENYLPIISRKGEDRIPELTHAEASTLVAELRAKADAVTDLVDSRIDAKNKLDSANLIQLHPMQLNKKLGQKETSLAEGSLVAYSSEIGFYTVEGNWRGEKPSDLQKAAFGAIGVAALAVPGGQGIGATMFSAGVAGTSFALAGGADARDALEVGLGAAVTGGIAQWATPQLTGLLRVDSNLGSAIIQSGVEAGVNSTLTGDNFSDFANNWASSAATSVGSGAAHQVTTSLANHGVNKTLAIGLGGATETAVSGLANGSINDPSSLGQQMFANALGAASGDMMSGTLGELGFNSLASTAATATETLIAGSINQQESSQLAESVMNNSLASYLMTNPATAAPESAPESTLADEVIPPEVAETYGLELATPATPEPLPAWAPTDDDYGYVETSVVPDGTMPINRTDLDVNVEMPKVPRRENDQVQTDDYGEDPLSVSDIGIDMGPEISFVDYVKVLGGVGYGLAESVVSGVSNATAAVMRPSETLKETDNLEYADIDNQATSGEGMELPSFTELAEGAYAQAVEASRNYQEAIGNREFFSAGRAASQDPMLQMIGLGEMAVVGTLGKVTGARVLGGKVGPDKIESFSTGAAFDGKLYPDQKVNQLVQFLNKRGVDVMETQGNPAFIGKWDGTGVMKLPANPTELQVKHELSHYIDFRNSINQAGSVREGVQNFVDMGRLGREQSVLDRLQNNRIWNQLNDAEQLFSIDYVERLRLEAGQ